MEKKHYKAIGFVTIRIVQRDLLRLFAQEQTFRKLYNSEESVDVLNSSAPFTFSIIQDVLRQELTFGITRTLIDPDNQNGNENLGLETLVLRMPDENEDLLDRIKSLRKKYKPINNLRRKLRAHRDEPTAYDIEYRLNVENWSVDDELIFEAIDDMRLLMKEIIGRLLNTNYEDEIEGLDAENLIEILRSSSRDGAV